MNKEVRTRFAPSPTGDLHIGGARTALFAYLWAKHNDGTFILRVEDTDRARTVDGAEKRQQEGLQWLGIEWDEGPGREGEYGPYRQSERLDLYREHVEQLVASGAAYYCFCTSERLDAMRKQQQREKKAPRYDRTCLTLSPEEVGARRAEDTPAVVRLRMPDNQPITFTDVVRGEITFNTNDIDDQVLQKSDGFPTYHLANVVDDHHMKITHVIRGEEWLPSTPKHIVLYNAFGWEAPEFVHLSVFLSKGGGKMSKRDGETSLLRFRDLGYLPEAVNNFSALLGWNPKTEEEFFTMEQLVERFELTAINAANPVFETEKLDWTNQRYMKEERPEDIVRRIKELASIESDESARYSKFLEWYQPLSEAKRTSIMNSLVERSKTLLEVADVVQMATGEVPEYDTDKLIWKKSDAPTTVTIFEALLEKLEPLSDEQFTAAHLEERLLPWIADHETWGNGDVLWPMRFALSGLERSPSPFEVAELLGKERSIERMKTAHSRLREHNG